MIFVPREKRHHDDIREGHPGIARTVEKIQRTFYFPGMYRKVKRYIKQCDSCERNKNDYMKPTGKMLIEKEPPNEPWKQLTADFMEMPMTTNVAGTEDYDELLVIVDRFSKQTILIPTRKAATIEEIFQLLWERVFSIFGIPDSILSDRDKIFRTNKWQKLMTDIGSGQLLSTAYHQQTDGQTERKIQEIRVFLRHYLDYEQKNWIQLAPLVQYAVNDAVSTTTGETPNFVTFGTERKLGRDLRITEDGITHKEAMTVIHQQVKLEIDWMSQKAKEYYDKTRRETADMKVGDKVYIRRRTSGEKKYNITTGRTSQKMDSLFIGPYVIERKLPNDNYKVTLPDRMRIHPVFHVSLLKKTGNPVSTTDVDVTDEFEVERILSKRYRKGQTEYLVRWKGYEETDDTWEPTKNLQCPEVLRRFNDSRKH
jgi:hypothetical protein